MRTCGKHLAEIVGLLVAALLVLSCAQAPVSTPVPTPTAATKAPATATAPPAPPAATPTTVAQAAQPSPTIKPATVKVGVGGGASDGPLYIAQERGYFREQGLTVEVIPFSSTPLMIAPLSTGELDAGAGTLSTALLNAIERGVNMKIVADKGSSNTEFTYNAVLPRKDLVDSGAIKSPKDLKGKKIALSNQQSGTECILWLVLNSGGLKTGDVELTTLGYPETIVGLTNKAVDAGFLIQPFLAQAVQQGVAVDWEAGYPQKYSGGVFQGASLAYSEPFVKNVDLGRRFMLAYTKGVRDFYDAFLKGKNKADTVALLVQKTTVKDPALFDKTTLPYINPDGKVDLPSMRTTLDYFKTMGYYTGKLQIDQIVDNQFVDYVIGKLGKYQ